MQEQVIVVGSDFSEESRAAVAYAARLARAADVELLVCHAWNVTGWSSELVPAGPSIEGALREVREAARNALEESVERLRAEGTRARAEFREGAASRQLVECAVEHHAQLLVAGHRGSARLSHVLLGSVSERLVRTSPCPVLITRNRDGNSAPPARLLVGIDFSRASGDALAASFRFGAALGIEQPPALVHAFQDERALWLASWSETDRTQHENHDASRVHRWADRRGLDVRASEILNLEGSAERVLLDAAARTNCDWIVLGLQGRTALASFLVGSTTLRILEHADRPVLVVPPSGPSDLESTD